MAKHDPNQALLDALRNPLRRSLLRRFVESVEMLSPKELAGLEARSAEGGIEMPREELQFIPLAQVDLFAGRCLPRRPRVAM